MFVNKLLLGPLVLFFTLIDMYYCNKRRVMRQTVEDCKSYLIFWVRFCATGNCFCQDAELFDLKLTLYLQ